MELKKMTKKQTQAMLGSGKDTVIKAECNGIEYQIKTYLTLQQQYNFVQSLINTTKVGDKYSPAMFEFAKRYALIEYFTDINIDNEKTAEQLAFNTCIVEDIIEAGVSFDYLVEAAKEEFQKNHEDTLAVYAATNNPLQSIVDALVGFIDKLTSTFEGLDNKKIAAMLDKVGKLDEKKIVSAIAATNKTKKKRGMSTELPTKKAIPFNEQISMEEVITSKE